MKLPDNHIAAHEGVKCNWCVGDPVEHRLFLKIHWCYGIPQNTTGGKWNSINSKYCGKYNYQTREVSEIVKLK